MSWLSLTLFALVAAATVASVHTWSSQLRAASSVVAEKVTQDLTAMQALMDEIVAGRKTPSDVDSYDPAQGEFVPDLRDPFVTGFYRPQLAVKPVSPLAGWAVGAAVSQPGHFVITSRPLNEVIAHGRSTEITNPAVAAAGVLDLATLTVLIAPLLLCGLLGLGLAREREGSLQLLLRASGVTAARVLLTRVGVATAVTALALLAAIAVAAAASQPPVGWGRASVAWTLLSLAYLLFWSGLAATVIALCDDELSSAVGLVAAWFGVTVLLPALAAAWQEDTQRSERIAQALVAAQRSDALVPRFEQSQALREALGTVLKRPLQALPECAARRGEVLRDYAGRFDYDQPIREALAQQQAAQDGSGVWWSPAGLVLQRFEQLAGNHRADFHAFANDAAQFHHRYRVEILRRLVDCDAIDAAGYARLPAYEQTSVVARVPLASLSFALGAAGVLMLGLGAVIARRRTR